MAELDDQIARVTMRATQVAIHLQELARNEPEAARARSALYALLRELAELKSERARRDALLEMEQV
jgi:hypothetical protein